MKFNYELQEYIVQRSLSRGKPLGRIHIDFDVMREYGELKSLHREVIDYLLSVTDVREIDWSMYHRLTYTTLGKSRGMATKINVARRELVEQGWLLEHEDLYAVNYHRIDYVPHFVKPLMIEIPPPPGQMRAPIRKPRTRYD